MRRAPTAWPGPGGRSEPGSGRLWLDVPFSDKDEAVHADRGALAVIGLPAAGMRRGPV